ncbi:MAG: hypothetical protein OXQ92_15225, partial [Boseongicola sp.]|nr:hypothetical protein [Boseongicola sp.]
MPNFDLRIWGSIAGFVCAATYLFGFAVLAGTDYGSVIGETTNAMAFLAQNPVLMSVWYLTIYVVNGLFLALLVLALEDRIAPQASEFARVMRTLGLIWATLVIGAGMAANVGLSKALA